MAFLKETAFDYLRRAHESGRLGHAYLITGPAGSGKRRLAEEMAALVNGCTPEEASSHPNVHIAEPESKLRRIVVDQVRRLEQELRLKVAGRKVAIIFEADRLQPQASNAFLKTLEEPPSNSLLLLVSSHPEMLLETIRSRCIKVTLRREGEAVLHEDEAAFLKRLAEFFKRGSRDLAAVFGLARDFQEVLSAAKARLAEHYESDLKREEDHYGKTTEGDWLEEREAYYKALVEAQYHAMRARLVEVLERWFGDVLRHCCAGGARLDFPQYEAETRRLAETTSLPDLLTATDRVDELRENLSRNAQEALVVEVGLLRVFSV